MFADCDINDTRSSALVVSFDQIWESTVDGDCGGYEYTKNEIFKHMDLNYRSLLILTLEEY